MSCLSSLENGLRMEQYPAPKMARLAIERPPWVGGRSQSAASGGIFIAFSLIESLGLIMNNYSLKLEVELEMDRGSCFHFLDLSLSLSLPVCVSVCLTDFCVSTFRLGRLIRFPFVAEESVRRAIISAKDLAALSVQSRDEWYKMIHHPPILGLAPLICSPLFLLFFPTTTPLSLSLRRRRRRRRQRHLPSENGNTGFFFFDFFLELLMGFRFSFMRQSERMKPWDGIDTNFVSRWSHYFDFDWLNQFVNCITPQVLASCGAVGHITHSSQSIFKQKKKTMRCFQIWNVYIRPHEKKNPQSLNEPNE